jgi:hypothetical protein
VTLTWSRSWNPDSESPNLHRALSVEEPIIHPKVAGSDILTRDPKRRATRKIQSSLKVQVQEFIKFTMSWLELDRKNGSFTQVHPLKRLE